MGICSRALELKSLLNLYLSRCQVPCVHPAVPSSGVQSGALARKEPAPTVNEKPHCTCNHLAVLTLEDNCHIFVTFGEIDFLTEL